MWGTVLIVRSAEVRALARCSDIDHTSSLLWDTPLQRVIKDLSDSLGWCQVTLYRFKEASLSSGFSGHWQEAAPSIVLDILTKQGSRCSWERGGGHLSQPRNGMSVLWCD